MPMPMLVRMHAVLAAGSVLMGVGMTRQGNAQ
jgi:hypothetical protein